MTYAQSLCVVLPFCSDGRGKQLITLVIISCCRDAREQHAGCTRRPSCKVGCAMVLVLLRDQACLRFQILPASETRTRLQCAYIFAMWSPNYHHMQLKLTDSRQIMSHRGSDTRRGKTPSAVCSCRHDSRQQETHDSWQKKAACHTSSVKRYNSSKMHSNAHICMTTSVSANNTDASYLMVRSHSACSASSSSLRASCQLLLPSVALPATCCVPEHIPSCMTTWAAGCSK